MKFSAFPVERDAIVQLVATAPGKYVVEIGCFEGGTTRELARACKLLDKTLIAIDPWDNSQDSSHENTYQKFLGSIAPFRDTVIVVRGNSRTVKLPDIAGKAGMVLIDGDHTYEGCLADLRRFYPLVASGGAVVVHDAFNPGWPGVAKALNDFCRELPKPITLHSVKYLPTAAEIVAHCYDEAGLTYFFHP